MGDAGNIHVLEAILIGIVMVGAISFVITFDAPTTTTEPERRALEESGTDALNIIYETPLTDVRYGNNTLSKFIALALQGNTGPLSTRLEELLPPATAYNVYINNGYGSLPVYVSHEPSGETVTSSKLLEPKWTYVFTERSHFVTSTPTSLGVYALPVYNSNPVDDGGVPLAVHFSGIIRDSGRTFNLTSYYSTIQGGPGSITTNVGLHLLNSEGEAITLVDRSSTDNTTYYVGYEDVASYGLPTGTKLIIQIPRGFDVTVTAAENEDWTILETVTGNSTGGRIVAELASTLNPTKGHFVFHMDNVVDLYDFHQLDMRLAGTVQGRAEAVIQVRDSPVPTGGDFHGVYASIPKPMGNGEANQWLVGFLNPRSLITTANATLLAGLDPDDPEIQASSRSITLTHVQIRQPEGKSLFSGVSVLNGEPGWSVTSASRLDWTGELNLTSNSMEEWTLQVTGTGTGTRREIRNYVNVDANVGSHTETLTRRILPAVFYDNVLPEGAVLPFTGYETTVGNGYALTTNAIHRGVNIPGSWHYNITPVAIERDNLNLVNITLEDTLVPIGSSAYVNVDNHNLLLTLADLGIPATTTFRVYAPYGLDNHTAIETSSITEGDVMSSGVAKLLVRDVNADGVQDVIVATTTNKIFVLDGRTGSKMSGYQLALDSYLEAQGLPTANMGDLSIMTAAQIDGDTVYLLGMAQGKPNVFAINADFTVRWAQSTSASYATYEVRGYTGIPATFDGFDITAIDASADVSGDGIADVLAADSNGIVFAFNGTTGDLVPSWIYDTSAERALVRGGVIGQAATDGWFVTTGSGSSVGLSQPINLTAGTYTTDPGAALTAELQKPYVDNRNPGLVAIGPNRETLWFVNGGSFDVIDAADIDNDGVTDFVGGAADGFVYAYNGTQSSFPLYGEMFATGTEIVDVAWLDADTGWSVSNDGYFMFTTDGWTTRTYYMDEVAAYYAFPGANTLSFADANTGYVAGDAGTMWKTETGGTTFGATAYLIKVWIPGVGYTATLPGTGEVGRDFEDMHAFDPYTVLTVGTVCPNCNGRATVIGTYDGGTNWKDAEWSGDPISKTLHRIIVVDPLNVIVVGQDGAVGHGFRESDQTWTFTKLTSVAGGETLYGGWFRDVTTGWVVGESGALYKTTDSGASWSKITVPTNRTLQDIDFLDPAKGRNGEWGVLVGDDSVYMETYDGGATWNLLPPYALTDYNRVNVLENDVANIAGGNTTTRAFAQTHAYMPESVFQTHNLNTLADGFYTDITIVTDHRYAGASTTITMEASVDGTNWFPLDPELADGIYTGTFGNDSFSSQYVGSDLHVRFTLGVDISLNQKSFRVNSFAIAADYAIGQSTGQWTDTFLVNAANAGKVDTAATTADYNATYGHIKSALQNRMWTLHVDGAVNDLAIVADMDGDGGMDVIIGIGETLSAANLSALGIPAGLVADQQNRVMAFNGTSGRGLWVSPELPGPVVFVRSAHHAHAYDSVPDVAAIVRMEPAGAGNYDLLYYLDGLDGSILGDPVNLTMPVTGIEVGELKASSLGNELAIGTSPPSTVTRPGYAYTYHVPTEPELLWRTNPSFKGVYSFTYEVARNSLFGVYPVEIEVSWTTGAGVALAQRSLTYFVVTPPNGAMPTSPIYNIELVTWFREWDLE